jgi:hypothetical protein
MEAGTYERSATPGPDRRLAAARAMGRPFNELTIATWLQMGRAWLAGAADMQRLNSSWDLALVDGDVELLERLLFQAEQVCAGSLYEPQAMGPAVPLPVGS